MQQFPVVTGPGRQQGIVRWLARMGGEAEEVGRGQEVKGLECLSRAFGLECKGGF